jgi:hypothetical protein
MNRTWRRRWKERLCKSSNVQAKIWWTNYLFDKKHGNLSPSVVQKFEEALLAELVAAERREAGRGRITSPLKIIEAAVGRSPAEFELKGTRRPVSPEPFCTIIDAPAFAAFYVTPGLGLGLETTERATTDEVWADWGTNLTSGDLNGTPIRSRRPFFWFTTLRRVNTIRAHGTPRAPDKIATEVRDRLGLNHYSRGIGLFLVKIPDGVVPLPRVNAPATLDVNGTNSIFAPSADAGGWGWAMCLLDFNRGWEELVTDPVPLTSDFEVERLGVVETPPPIDVNDAGQLRLIKKLALHRLKR